MNGKIFLLYSQYWPGGDLSSNTALGKPLKNVPFFNGRAIKALTPRPFKINGRPKKKGGKVHGVLWPQVSP